MVERKRAEKKPLTKNRKESNRYRGTFKHFEDDWAVDPRCREFVPPRGNVGARNPYVLAMRKLQIDKMKKNLKSEFKVRAYEKTDEPSLSPEEMKKISMQGYGITCDELRSLMEEAFREKLSFEEFFDPLFGSPLYYGIYHATLRLAKICPKQYRQSLEYLQNDPARKTGTAPLYCGSLPWNEKLGQQQQIPVGRDLQYKNNPASSKQNHGIEFNDPVQGCIADCWFISALSSVAFVETTILANNNKYTAITPPIKVFPPGYSKKSIDIPPTSESFYTDANVTTPYYAHINPTMAQQIPDKTEIWPCYYEKCFANYYQQQRTPITDPAPTHFANYDPPLYSPLNYGLTYDALEDLTGEDVTDPLKKLTRTFITNPPDLKKNPAAVIANISRILLRKLATGTFVPLRMPAIAYTYLSSVAVDAKANHAAFGEAVIYNMPGIPANHSFSLLGLYRDPNSIDYVVLRNPWGLAGDKASFNAYSQGFWTKITSNLLSAYVDVTDPKSEGIFGLHALCFMRYFESYGWTSGF